MLYQSSLFTASNDVPLTPEHLELISDWKGVALSMLRHAKEVLENGLPSSKIFDDEAKWLFGPVDDSNPFSSSNALRIACKEHIALDPDDLLAAFIDDNPIIKQKLKVYAELKGL